MKLRRKLKDNYMLYLFNTNADLEHMKRESSLFDKFYYLFMMKFFQLIIVIVFAGLVGYMVSHLEIHPLIQITTTIICAFILRKCLNIIIKQLMKNYKGGEL